MTNKHKYQQYIPIQIKLAKQLRIKFISITISPVKAKKYRITLKDGSRIDYGAVGMSDYLIHRDKDRRKRFHDRFKNNKGYNNPYSGLFYSARLLW